MLKLIVNFLNLQLSTLNYWEELMCLCETKDDGKGVKQPMAYISEGQWKAVNFDNKDGMGYWRLRADSSEDRTTNAYAVKTRITRTYPLRFVFAVRRSKLSADDAYSFQRIADTVSKYLTTDNGPLLAQIGANKVVITPTAYNGDPKAVWTEETEGTGTMEPMYELVYGAINFDVTVTGDLTCFAAECDNVDPDILHTFDFCRPTVIDRLTDEQVACLEAALCEAPEPCADATARLFNTVPTLISTTPIASGASANITAPDATAVLKDTAGNTLLTEAIPSNVSENITAPDGTVTLNGSPYGSVRSGGTLDVMAGGIVPLSTTNMLTSFGFKQSVAGTTPNLFRFRKTTGATEFNVAADADGYPDIATAWTNLGADSAFLVRAYDLSGNSRDAYWTASTAPQPRLAMAYGDSKKQVQAAHITNQYMQCDCPITVGQTWTIYMAFMPSEMAGGMVLCGGTGATFKWWINTDSLNRVYLYDGVSQNPVTSNYSVTQRAPLVLAVQFKTNALRVYVNGTLVLSHNTWSVLASSMFQIARRVDGGGSIGQFNWNGIAAYTGDYDAAINTAFCEIYQPQ